MPETIVVNENSNEINKKNLKYITLTFCYVFIAYYFLINGRAIFPNWTDAETNEIFIYLVGVVAFLTVAIPLGSKLNLKYQSKLIDVITNFSLAFPIFWIAFIIIKDAGLWFQNITPIQASLIIPTVFFQVCIVASSEEIIFRGTIFPLLSKINVVLGVVLTSILFALFHLNAYGGNIFSIAIALLMGLLLALLYMKFNIGTAIAFHAVYNLMILGALII